MIKPILEEHNGITVLRDDKIQGGTKARFLYKLLDPTKQGYVYATPAYGGFQIALAATLKDQSKQATIFVAKRKDMHPNTKRAKELGAKIIEVPYGYLNNTQAKAKKHCETYNHQYLEWGANYGEATQAIAETMRAITKELGEEPKEVWCTIGSGVLAKGILEGTDTAIVHGVSVGKEYTGQHDRLRVHTHHLPFEKESRASAPFPSSSNYDRKAWEYCTQRATKDGRVLFWNVLG